LFRLIDLSSLPFTSGTPNQVRGVCRLKSWDRVTLKSSAGLSRIAPDSASASLSPRSIQPADRR